MMGGQGGEEVLGKYAQHTMCICMKTEKMNTLRKREHQSEWDKVLMEACRQLLSCFRVSVRQLWQFTKKGLTFVKCLSLSLSRKP